jgi:hypothetical protein
MQTSSWSTSFSNALLPKVHTVVMGNPLLEWRTSLLKIRANDVECRQASASLLGHLIPTLRLQKRSFN